MRRGTTTAASRAVSARAIGDALAADEGDVLVFLPGAGEIRRVEELLGGSEQRRSCPCMATSPQAQQDRALRPDAGGRRKVILATSIAETSLTIDGVRVVVDAGLSRVPRFSARTGMTRLETVRVSKAVATQRAGRAGRQAPGVAYRLWSEPEQAAGAVSRSRDHGRRPGTARAHPRRRGDGRGVDALARCRLPPRTWPRRDSCSAISRRSTTRGGSPRTVKNSHDSACTPGLVT